MTTERQFLENGLQRTLVDEFLEEELERAGYDGMEMTETPGGLEITLYAEKPGMVIGKGGDNIRKITSELESRFNLEDLSINVQEVEEPDLSADIVADKLANALERGWYFRSAGAETADRVMDTGAKGIEIVFSGKISGARARVEKFNRGYIKHNGQPSLDIVEKGQSKAVMPLGTIGVTVKIIPPNADLPDNFVVYDDVDVEDMIADDVDELLEETSDEESSDQNDSEEEYDEEVIE